MCKEEIWYTVYVWYMIKMFRGTDVKSKNNDKAKKMCDGKIILV